MRPTRIAELVAERLWKARTEIRGPFLREDGRIVELLGGEDAPLDEEYDAHVELPGAILLDIRGPSFEAWVDMNGHSTILTRFDAFRIIRTWRAVQAAAILEMLDPMLDMDEVQARAGTGIVERLVTPVVSLFGFVPARWPGQNVAEELDSRLAEEIRRGRYERIDGSRPHVTQDGRKRRRKVAWHRLRDDLSFLIGSDVRIEGDVPFVMVSHPEHGHIKITGERTLRAYRASKSHAFTETLTGTVPRLIHLPQAGNARIARIARICRDAVTYDPEMRDGRGVPVRPLVERHLPDLLSRHAAAARNAPAESLDEIDSDLERGVEIIRLAVEDAMRISTDARMGELREQIRFLERRHPDANGDDI